MREHRRIGSPLPDFLLPGIEPASIRAGIEGLGFDPADEAVELFARHNGTDNERYFAARASMRGAIFQPEWHRRSRTRSGRGSRA